MAKLSTIDLNLGSGEDLNHPRRVVPFRNYLLAFGGDNGTITAISLNCESFNAGNNNNGTNNKSSIIQRYDDPIRALAVSPDELRIAVGFDDGSTKIYTFESSDITTDYHPFLSSIQKSKNGINSSSSQGGSDSQDLFDDDLLSQDVDDQVSSNGNGRVFSGPRADAPVRSLAFDPRSSSKNSYYLAIATESSPGFGIYDVTSGDTSSELPKFLAEEADKAHDGGGVRSFSYSPSQGNAAGGIVGSSLGMDGRLCLWNMEEIDDPSLKWDLMHKDNHYVVKKTDLGEWNGAEVADRCSVPVWRDDGMVLGLPGECGLQFRKRNSFEKNDSQWESRDLIVDCIGEKDGQGHVQEIVAIGFEPEGRFVVTGGRDNKICLWEIFDDIESEQVEDDQPSGKFLKEISSHESLCTQLLWCKKPSKDKYLKEEDILCVVLENGTMKTIVGRDNIVPSPVTALPANKVKVLTKPLDEPSVNEKSDQEEKKDSNDYEDVNVSDLKDSLAENTDQPGTHPKLGASSISREEISSQSKKKRLFKQKNLQPEESDDESLDFDLEPEKNDLGTNDEPQKTKFVSDEASEDGDEDDQMDVLQSVKDSTEISPPNDYEDIGVVVDNDDFAQQGNDDENEIFDHDANGTPVELPEPQPAFAPSSTPIGMRRILCWNHIGVITLRDEGPNNIVDISFLDSAFNRPISFTDNLNFIVGSLGEEGGIFVTDIMDDEDDAVDENVRNVVDGLTGMSEATKAVVKRSERKKQAGGSGRPTGSCVYFHRFETFGNLKDKDWHVTLPDGERALGCACGEGWSAVVTSRRFLRLFSNAGMQGPILWLKGDPVTVVGRGRFLAVLYHECNPLVDGTQKLAYVLFDAMNCSEIATGSIAAISSGCSLSWAGFSNDFSLAVMDSDGMVSLLISLKHDTAEVAESSGFGWAPMLDTMGLKKSSEDHFWPVHIENGKLICVVLKGGVKYPDAARRPLTTTLNLRLPLAKGATDKSASMEEISIRANMALLQKKFVTNFIGSENDLDIDDLDAEYNGMCAKVDKVTLKLFIAFAESGKVERALDLSRRLHLEKSFDIAITVADRLNLIKLSDKIIALKELRFNLYDEEDEIYDRDVIEFSNHDYPGDNESDSRRISPDVSQSRDKRKSDEEETTSRNVRIKSADDQDTRKGKSQSTVESARRRLGNPFAKKCLESSLKPSPPKSPSRKPKLSRTSTFSAQSREMSKLSKRIL